MIAPAQSRNLQVKPRWVAPVGIMESVVAYNCRKYGMPRPAMAMPMWEGAGNRTLDLSGKGNHGAIIGADWVANGLDFNGTTDWVDVGVMNQLDGSGEMTVIMSVNVTENRDHWLFARSSDGAADSVLLWADDVCGNGNTDTFAFNVGVPGTQENRVNGDSGLRTLNTWHTVAGVFNGNYRGLYHNGVLNAEHNNGAQLTIPNDPDEFFLGRWEDQATNELKGSMRYAYIYNTALTAAQIKFLYDDPYFMFRLPEELYGYTSGAPPVGAIMKQFQKANIGADLYNGAIIA